MIRLRSWSLLVGALALVLACGSQPAPAEPVELQGGGRLTPADGRTVTCDVGGIVIVELATKDQAARHAQACQFSITDVDWKTQKVLAAFATKEQLVTTMGDEGMRFVALKPDPEDLDRVTALVTAYGKNARICDARIVDAQTTLLGCMAP